MLGGALLFCGALTLARALFLKRLVGRERDTVEMERRHKVSAVGLGVFVGFVLGVTSAGSGAIIAVGLILLFRLVPTRVVGTDVFHAAILLWAAAAAHIVAGNVDFALAGTILVGSVPGVWVGSHLSVRVPTGACAPRWPSCCSGRASDCCKGGMGVPGFLIAAVPVVAAVLIGWSTLRDRRREVQLAPPTAAPTRS